MSSNQVKTLLSIASGGDIDSFKQRVNEYLDSTHDDRLRDVVHQKSGDGLLHVLARFGHIECLAFLLEKGMFVDQRNLDDKTSLHESAQSGQVEALKVLLDNGAQVNALKRADWTALMLACTKEGNLDCVKTLTNANADPGLTNKDGWTCFQLAVRTGDLDILSHLLDLDPKLWKTVSKNGRTSLHTACLAGKLGVVKLLLSLGGKDDWNKEDSCGSTPLMEAARGNFVDCVKCLLEMGKSQIDIEKKDKMGRTVVQVAAQAGSVEVLEFLKDKWNLDMQEGALHSAAREGQTDTVKKLLEWGYEVDSR